MQIKKTKNNGNFSHLEMLNLKDFFSFSSIYGWEFHKGLPVNFDGHESNFIPSPWRGGKIIQEKCLWILFLTD